MHRPISANAELAEQRQPRSGVSLLFESGRRPDVAAVERLLAAPDRGGPATQISHRPPDGVGWIELLASGLTFELHGLHPAPSAPMPEPAHCFGLARDTLPACVEAVSLIPAGHIAAGAGMMPVVRTITGLAANFALLLPSVAVCWQPVESWIEPGYFARVIVSWLSGGPFPALGLTALERQEDGSVESVGLAFFRGQEVRVEARAGELPAETAKLAMRVVDHVARHGPIERLTQLDSPSGEVVFAEPSRPGDPVKVWRGR